MKKTITIMMYLLSLQNGDTQNITYHLDITSESQYNLTKNKTNWANLIDFSVETKLWKGASASAEAISTYNEHNDEPIADDLQGYSNINTESKPLRLSVLGISQQINKFTLFVGIRNTGADYFESMHTSFFSGSSHGIHAPLANNYNVATYPMAEMCLHTEWKPTKHLTFKFTLYNGQAGETISEQFQIRKKLKNISTLSYQKSEKADSGYFCIGMMTGQNRLGNHATALFGITEIPLISTTHPLLCGILETAYDNSQSDDDILMCRSYYAVGAITHLDDKDNRHLGVIVNKAFYKYKNKQTTETDIEINYSQKVGIICIQPILHIIKTGVDLNTIAMLRLSLAI
jgi:hypothetical protein